MVVRYARWAGESLYPARRLARSEGFRLGPACGDDLLSMLMAAIAVPRRLGDRFSA